MTNAKSRGEKKPSAITSAVPVDPAPSRAAGSRTRSRCTKALASASMSSGQSGASRMMRACTRAGLASSKGVLPSSSS